MTGEDVRVRAFTPLEREPGGFYAGHAEMWAGAAARSGAVSDDELRGWLESLHVEQAANRYLAGLTQLFIRGPRPA